MNSSSNYWVLFSVMFSDSDIAKPFQYGHTKAGYIAYFDLAPYSNELMLSKLPDCSYVSLSFDESSNS